MISFSLSEKKILESKADCFIVFSEQDKQQSLEIGASLQKHFPLLEKHFEKQNFTAKQGSLCTLSVVIENEIKNILFVGLGKKEDKTNTVEMLRRTLGSIIRFSEKKKYQKIAVELPQADVFGISNQDLAKEVTIVFSMANYHFDQFITDKERKFKAVEIELVVFENKQEVQDGLNQGEVIAKAVNQARLWVDLPPAELTPVAMADNAEIIAKKHNLKLTIFDEKKVNELGMGGLAAVSRGSDRDCRFVIMEYKTDKKDAPTLGFVGKGITFDSGGLSLKPPSYMETMKEDMSGSAAVISTMDVIGKLKPEVNIVAIAALSENLPSGKATKPGDIVTFYNGKTAEVLNTDAEGRLVLADALSYAVKHYKLDGLVDLATLTGACAYSFGPFYTGMMSKYDDFAGKIKQAGQNCGDHVWSFPFHDDYKAAIKSSLADISNIGNKRYMAGAITAGFFLSNFVDEKTPWVHLDIAGTAFNVPDRSYYRNGATGVGVRLLVELAMNWK